MANRFEVATIFRAVDRMSAPIRRIQNRINIMARSASRALRGVQRATQGVLKGFKRVGKAGLFAGAMLAAPLVAATNAGITFEQTIVNAAAKISTEVVKGTESFERLEKAAMKTGATTEFSATQSAEALNFLATAGFNVENSIAALPGVVDLATVSSISLGEATDIATDSLGALGLATKDPAQLTKNLARVNDVLAKASTSANFTLVELFETLKDGAPVGVAAGQSFETITTLAAAMANAGIKGTRGATALKNVFLGLNVPGSEAAQIMHNLGVETKRFGKIRDAVEVFQDFTKAADKLPEAQRLAVFEKIFGRIGLAGAINISNASGELDEFRKTLLASGGTAKKVAGIMRNTTRGSLNSLASAVEGVSIELFAMNRGPMKEAIDNATKWVRANGPLIAQRIGEFFLYIANNIDKVVSAFKKVATVFAVLWTLNTVLGVIQGTLAVITFMMAANPIVLGALAIAGAATAIYLAWDPLKAFFTDLFGAIGVAFDASVGKMLDQIQAIKRTFSEFNFGEGALTSNADRTKPSAYATGNVSGGVPGISSPLNRQASILEEKRTTNKTEVLIRDETGRAEVAPNAGAAGLTVQHTGEFE